MFNTDVATDVVVHTSTEMECVGHFSQQLICEKKACLYKCTLSNTGYHTKL